MSRPSFFGGEGAWRIAIVLAVAAIAVVAVVIGIGWKADRCPANPAEMKACQEFVRTPQFLVWLLLLCAEAVFWVLALLPVAITLKYRMKELHGDRQLTLWTVLGLIFSGLVLLGVTVGFVYGFRHVPGRFDALKEHEGLPDPWPLPQHSLKLGILSGVALTVGIAAIVTVWLAGLRLQQMALDARKPDKEAISRFLGLQDDLNTMLAIAGGIIGLATLSTGALRNAAIAVGLKFDSQYVLLYGLFFTGVLAVAYAPSYLAMRAAGAHLRDRAYPLLDPDDSSFFDVVGKRKAFDEFMQLNLSASSTFKAGVAILTPLASGLIALLIPKFT